MESMEHLGSSPALQILKQLEASLAIEKKIELQFGSIFNTASLLNEAAKAQDRLFKPIASMASALGAAQASWLPDITTSPMGFEAMQPAWIKDISAVATAWETAYAARFPRMTACEKAIEKMQRDWARETAALATSLKSIEKAWAFPPLPLAQEIEGFQNLTKDMNAMARLGRAEQLSWRLDTAHITQALQPLKALNLQANPAWTASISIEKIERPRATLSPTPLIRRPDSIFSRQPFNNYRMAESYDLLSDFERDLRDFIHAAMFEVFGMGWEKRRLPSGMREKWAEKRQKARASGESSERLIDYADFTDYVSIISQNNNWNEIFRSRFGRLQFVQESLYRLQPVRVCTMHSRILSREMWLILQTETMLLSERMWN